MVRHQTARRAAIALQILMLIGLVPPSIMALVTGAPPPVLIADLLLLVLGAAVSYGLWRGHPLAYSGIVVLSIANSAVAPPVAALTFESLLVLLMPPVVALIIGRPVWVVAAAIATPLLFGLRLDPAALTISPALVGIYVSLIAGIALARVVVDAATRDAFAAAAAAEEARASSESQALQLAEANRRQEQQLDEQRRLLDLVATLEIPGVDMADGVMLAPIIGHLDSRRASSFAARLLETTHQKRLRHIVLDIAGVAVVDAAVARAIIDLAASLRLLGCRVSLSGMTAETALLLTRLDLGLDGITTVRSPQEALAAERGG